MALRKITADELKEILSKHLEWLRNEDGWKRADLSEAKLSRANLSEADLSGANLYGANLSEAKLSRANLSEANLSEADLSGANLYGANLSRANLYGANLYGANLSRANLYGANLSGADLYEANLSRANLYGANLSGADLYGANLSRANLYGANLYGANLYGADGIEKALNLFYPIACPESGTFIGWKKAIQQNVATSCIVKLRIIGKRSSATTRKCRCNEAEVLEIQDIDGNVLDCLAFSEYNKNFTYKAGTTVFVDNFDENRWNECAPGIHFYITREEAVRH